MRTLRATLNRWVIAALVAWSLLNLFVQTFKGTNVGGLACRTDPTCGEIAWIPTAAWLGGILVILAIGFALRAAVPGSPSREEPPIPIADRLLAVAVVLAVLALAAVAFWSYQANRVP
jgi:heme A synthase